MDVQLPLFEDSHRSIFSKVQQLCQHRLAALASMELEDIAAGAVDYAAMLGQEGLFDPALGKALEGEAPRPDLRALCVVRYLLAQASGLCDGVFGAQVQGLYPIALCGNEEQRAIFLPAMAAGQTLVAVALLDGDQPMTVQVTAEGRYVLTGSKALVPMASIADHFVVLARHKGSDPARYSLFIIDAAATTITADAFRSPLPMGTVTINGVDVDAETRLGGDGQGLVIVQTSLDMMRLPAAAACLGIGKRALYEGTDLMLRRGVSGRALKDQPVVQSRIADALTQLEAASGLVQHAAYRRDTSTARESKGTTMARQLSQDAAEGACTLITDLMGLRALSTTDPWTRFVAEARALRLETDFLDNGRSVIAHSFLAGIEHDRKMKVAAG